MRELPARSTGHSGGRNGSRELSGHALNVPSEFAVGGVYMPPMLIAGMAGLVLAMLTARLLNRYRLSRYFFYPPLVFVALTIIYTVLIGTFVVPG